VDKDGQTVWAVKADELPGIPLKFMTGLQRLPNGNTLITEGACGRIFEVTPGHEIVWEYINPYFGKRSGVNMVYGAYRVPYQWIPQIAEPEETTISRMDISKFRVFNSKAGQTKKVTRIQNHITR